MRGVAGTCGGVRLGQVPEGTRPTSDRVREGLFNALGQFFDGGTVLDLFAGTGALGIEALSRGCDRAVFVDQSGVAVRAIHENLRLCGLEGRAEVLRSEAGRALGSLRSWEGFYLIFLDPPYRISRNKVESLLARLPGLLAAEGRIVLETNSEREAVLPGVGREYRYGGTRIVIYEPHQLDDLRETSP